MGTNNIFERSAVYPFISRVQAVHEGRFFKTENDELMDVCMDRRIRRVDVRLDGWTDGVKN